MFLASSGPIVTRVKNSKIQKFKSKHKKTINFISNGSSSETALFYILQMYRPLQISVIFQQIHA